MRVNETGCRPKDRIDPVASESLDLDKDLLHSFPEGYRHLAYLQSRAGLTVKNNLPGLKGPEVEALYRRGKRWLTEGIDAGD